MDPIPSWPEPIRRMQDGTIKQINPCSGTTVWTVARRGNRPLALPPLEPRMLEPLEEGRYCAFCEHRYLETPPEKCRVVEDFGGWRRLPGVRAEHVADTVAAFRRIPNLFEIVSYDYWRTNYAFRPPDEVIGHRDDYLSSEEGRAHVLRLLRLRRVAEGVPEEMWDGLSAEDKLAYAIDLFAGSHDVIVARRHYVEGATHDDQLAGSGTLTADEHHQYTWFTVDALHSLYAGNRYARYVTVFQNWLRPAGASFDHLHKQLVALDDRSVRLDQEVRRLRSNPNLYNEYAVDYAARQNLTLMENEHAVAFAGFGHRFPALEVFSKSRHCRPWEHTEQEVRGFSDLLHACHAATGVEVASNEEWHYQPPDLDVPMPWRVVLKWRLSTLAGFEGGTQIYLNTIDPWALRDRVVGRLHELRAEGRLAPGTAVAAECACHPNSLRYNPVLG